MDPAIVESHLAVTTPSMMVEAVKPSPVAIVIMPEFWGRGLSNLMTAAAYGKSLKCVSSDQ